MSTLDDLINAAAEATRRMEAASRAENAARAEHGAAMDQFYEAKKALTDHVMGLVEAAKPRASKGTT